MSSLDAYERTLLEGWEEVFKRGQLTFWVLLSLREGPKHMAQIREWLAEMTDGMVSAEERSLYRSLQRFYDSELVTASSATGHRGPERKVYALSSSGERVLAAFIDRDIRLFSKPEVLRLLG